MTIKNIPKQEAVQAEEKIADVRVELIKVHRLIVDANKSLAAGKIKKAQNAYNSMKSIYEKIPKQDRKHMKKQISRLEKQIRRSSRKNV